MARIKKIYKDEEHELLKKRHKIRTAVSATLAMFWIVAICICGGFQHNDIIVGWGVIAIGVANTAYTMFAIHIRRRGWRIMTTYDSDELYRDKYRFPKKLIEEESKQIEIRMWIVDIIIAVSGICFFIAGIKKLI